MRKNRKVAFQGVKGSYSEMAAHDFFGLDILPVEYRTFSEVFESVEENQALYGIVPIENSLEGSVTNVYDLFLEHSLKVWGETILKIEHSLIVNHGVSEKAIKKVYSHPQALAQCRKYLEKLKCQIIPYYNTAGSVKMIKVEKSVDSAAVASEYAATIYDMKILRGKIADNQNNFTRFFIISKKEALKTENDKTSIIFSTKHLPGALYGILTGFANRNINLTKIESRPTKRDLWTYNFYLDFEGNQYEEECRDALKELQSKTKFVKILGSYPNAMISKAFR